MPFPFPRSGSGHRGPHRTGGRGPHGAGVFHDGGGWYERDGAFAGRARGRRMFDGGELRLVLLRLIGDQPRHGYDLIRAIEERTGGAYAPSPGVVYPTLTLLADMGQIEERPSEGNRKLYAATAEGERVLAERAGEIAALMARLDAAGALRERTEGPPVRRAMHNLRAVLRHKLAAEGIDRATLDAAVALIDEAAQKIERL